MAASVAQQRQYYLACVSVVKQKLIEHVPPIIAIEHRQLLLSMCRVVSAVGIDNDMCFIFRDRIGIAAKKILFGYIIDIANPCAILEPGQCGLGSQVASRTAGPSSDIFRHCSPHGRTMRNIRRFTIFTILWTTLD